MQDIIKALHALLQRHWAAAGKPAHATELCLWDLERVLDNLPLGYPTKELLADAVELLEAWIFATGAPPTAEEIHVLALVHTVPEFDGN